MEYPIGLVLQATTLSWPPWGRLFDCGPPPNFECAADGVMTDVIEMLGKMYNFSVRYSKEPTGNWGLLPTSGSWTDPNATFEGMQA